MTADEVMRAYAEAWGRGDAEAAFAFYSDAVLERTDGTGVTVQVEDRLTSADAVALLLREVATRGEEVLDLRRVNVYRVRDGRITEIRIFEADQYAVDEFFG
jgi:ketosteroid isomerase-like protein